MASDEARIRGRLNAGSATPVCEWKASGWLHGSVPTCKVQGRKKPWFETEVLSALRSAIQQACACGSAPYRRGMPEPQPICTIGHSTRTIPEFVDLLRTASVRFVVDIRSVPRSRTNPQYNLNALPQELASYQIGHAQIPELGGLRKKSKVVAPKANGFWTNQSFHNYADYALSDEFHLGLSQLLEISTDRRCAIMCSEAVWWRCHRRIVADYLLQRGEVVFHLMGRDRVEPAKLNAAATELDGKLLYPAGSAE